MLWLLQSPPQLSLSSLLLPTALATEEEEGTGRERLNEAMGIDDSRLPPDVALVACGNGNVMGRDRDRWKKSGPNAGRAEALRVVHKHFLKHLGDSDLFPLILWNYAACIF